MDWKKVLLITAETIMRSAGLLLPGVLGDLRIALSDSEKAKQKLEQKIDKAYESMKETYN
jgi:hypothetical protein